MTLLQSIFLYGSETWSLKEVEELRLMIFDRKVLKDLFGQVFGNYTEIEVTINSK